MGIETENTTVTYVGSGRYSDVFKVSNGRHSVIMKLSYYRDNTLNDFVSKLKQGDAEGARRVKNKDSIMVSSAFGDATNALVANHTSPHFVYVYCSADCRHLVDKFRDLLRDRIKTSTPTQLKYNNVSFMEQFSTDMTRWLRGQSKTLTDDAVRKAVFGVLYTLAILQKTFPGFRHNDLSTNNVLVKRLRTPMNTGYAFGGQTYYLDRVPVLAAISDYDFTHVPNHPTLSNERVLGGKYRVTDMPNKTYDTHFFLKSVSKSFANNKMRLPGLEAFLASLPFHKEDRLDTTEVPDMDPPTLLRHPYFDPVRRPIPPRVQTYGL
jgi:hypothetical protein